MVKRRARQKHERMRELIKECLRCECDSCGACRSRLAEMLEHLM